MANRVVIEVVARYKDETKSALDATGRAADKVKKKLEETAGAAAKLGKQKPKIQLDADDRASNKIVKAMNKARSFATKTYKSTLDFTDKASTTLNRISGAARSFSNKTFSAVVKIFDYATTPLQKIKNSLFSIKTLVAGIVAGAAAKTAVLNPIALADAYSGTKIGFSTLLGEERGQQMMDEMDAFAKKTPFKTSNVISNAQKMMAYGWDANRILSDMEVIGNAAAATGKMDQGLESIVYALSEIRSKGKLSTQELNQLASAGIKAKAYLAEGLGYGTSDEGMMKLASDLEKGAIGANQAIELILEGMKEFDGMMDRSANETVEGLKSQLEDVFEINMARRWGQGLQDGAKRGLGSIVSLLDKSEDSLEKFGDVLYEIGQSVSNWAADKLETSINTIKSLMDTDEFSKASLGGKVGILWDKVIAEPFSDWWNSSGKKKIAEKAGEIGTSLGTGISNGLLALLGVDAAGALEDGASIGGSFAKGFADGFDGSAITEAFAKAITDVWDVLPWWAKALVGAKALGGVGSVLGGVNSLLKGAGAIPGLIGATGNAMVGGSGILGVLADIGYAITGGAAGSALTGGIAAATGGGGLGALLGVGSAIKSFAQGNKWAGGTKLGLVGTGAAIGTAIMPGAGTLIGAGVGGLGAMFGGEKLSEWFKDAWGVFISDCDKIKEKAGVYFSETLPATWESIKSYFNERADAIAEGWDGVKTYFKEKADAIGSWFNEKKTSLKNSWNSLWERFSGNDASASAERNASGGIIGGRTLSWLGEEGPESVIPLGAKHRKRAVGLFQQTADALGIGTGNGGIQVNMGGVTIQVNGGGDVLGSIEAQKEEIAEQVAAIFYRVLEAQYKNMPAKGGVLA